MLSLAHDKQVIYTRIDAEEEAGLSLQHERQQQRLTWRHHTTYTLALICCSIITFLAGRYTSHMSLSFTPRSPIPHSVSSVSYDCTRTYLQTAVPTESVTFQPDPRFSGPSTPASDVAWTSLLPPGEGFIAVPNPSQYGLPPGKNSTSALGSALYDVSAFHQLHCLAKIREHVSLLRFAAFGKDESTESGSAGERAWEKVVKPQEEHMGHCFDYLRQGIMCAGDMTLEWPMEGSQGVVDGWGVRHECRSWEAILRVVEKRSV